MADQKIQHAQMQSPNSLRTSSFKPSTLKTLQTLQSTQRKFEENKINMGGESEPPSKDKPNQRIVLSRPPDGIRPIHKKYSAQIDPKTLSSPSHKTEQGSTVSSIANTRTAQKSGSTVLSKEDLRTTFSSGTFQPKPLLDNKQALRKTTHTPFRLFDPKSPQHQRQVQQTNKPMSPQGTFKKMTFQKRFQTSNNQFVLPQPPKPTPAGGQKKSPIVNGFYIGKTLGTGKFGEVCLAKHVTTGFVCALKKIVKSKAIELNMINQIIQQIKLHAFVTHPNIVQFYGCFCDDTNLYLILEYMEGGTLFEYMNQHQKLSEPDTVGFVKEITQAVKYLHDSNIAHRDIKPQNIVLNYGMAKLCDFGWSARVQGSRKTYCGTFDYAPPQILQRKEYDLSVDLWCLGVLTYQLLTGKVPFEHQQRQMVMQKIVNVDKDKIEFPRELSEVAKDFIKNLVKKNPNQRTKSYKLLSHPFLDRHQKKSN